MWVEVADEVEFVTEEGFKDSGVPAIVLVAAGGRIGERLGSSRNLFDRSRIRQERYWECLGGT